MSSFLLPTAPSNGPPPAPYFRPPPPGFGGGGPPPRPGGFPGNHMNGGGGPPYGGPPGGGGGGFRPPPPQHHHQQQHQQFRGPPPFPGQYQQNNHQRNDGPPRFGGGGGGGGGGGPPQRMDDRMPIPLPQARRGPSADDKLTTMFVAGIVDGVSDVWMERLLQVCGSVRSWRRMQDAEGKPKSFGFCVYEQPESVSRALRILNGEGDGELSEGVSLSVSGGQPKRLKCNVDDTARKHVESYRGARENSTDEQQDREVRDQILAIVASLAEDANRMDIDSLIQSAVADGGGGRSPDRGGEEGGGGALDDLPPEMAPEQRELISREISTFRERSAAKDKRKKEEEERRIAEMDRMEREARSRHHAIDLNAPRGGYHGEAQQQAQQHHQHPHHQGPNGRFSGPMNGAHRGGRPLHDDMEVDDEEEDKRRAEKREEEAKQAFAARERRWLAMEGDRLRWLASCASEGETESVKLAGRVARLTASLAVWRDDADCRTDEERRELFSRMQRARRTEIDADAQDRLNEQAEIARKAAEPAETLEDAVPAVPEPEVVIGKIMTKEERTQAIQDLIGIIPADKEGLFAWHIKWECLEESVMANKIRPWIRKKITEYLGEEELEVVEFVVELLHKHTPAAELLDEMMGALDDEAEAFVMVLWRMLIYETESRSQGLG
ncbi:hypothetical protein HKX48_002858 [Thoreauomyces humboldtii]|nr:hypothetical protein HKX48_002858 [Thoreauomyces humboldtii]